MLPDHNVEKYLPQRPPVVMIGALISAEEGMVVSSLDIKEENLFVEKGFFTESGLMENIAQTAAAGTGYKHLKNGTPVPVGFIASVRSLQVKEFPAVGTTIQTTIKELQEVMGVLIVEGQVMLNERVIATAEMRIFTPADNESST